MNLNSINNTNNNSNNHNNDIVLTELHFDNIPVMNDKKPWATIILTTVFFFIGIACLVLATLGWLDIIEASELNKLIPLTILGILFLPLGYFVWLTIAAFCKCPGYTFDRIPKCTC